MNYFTYLEVPSVCAGKWGRQCWKQVCQLRGYPRGLRVSSEGPSRWPQRDAKEGTGERPREGDSLGLSERWAVMWEREGCDPRNTMSSKCSHYLLGFPGWRTEPHEESEDLAWLQEDVRLCPKTLENQLPPVE